METALRPLLDTLPEPLLLLLADGRLLHVNRAATAWLRRDAAALAVSRLHELLDADEGALQALLRQGWRSAQFTPARMRWRRGDGSVEACRFEMAHVGASDVHPAAILLRLLPGAASSGRFLALSERIESLAREVARRHAAETALQEHAEWLQVVLRSIGDAVIATDAGGHVVFMNPVAERLCGCPAGEARTRPVERVMPLTSAQGPLAAHPIRRALAERQVVGLDAGTLLERPAAGALPVDDAAGPIVDGAGQVIGAVIVFREITERLHAEAERRELERRLRAAQKMEAIGTLAGGIAHDFNNVLGAILGNAGLALDELAADHPVAPRLAQIDRAGRRARELVRQILAFSRRQPQKLERVDLGALARECVGLLRSTLPSSAELRLDGVDEAPVMVLGDASQLDQVLMNLCTNAWQALVDGSGCIEVSVGVEHGPPPPGLLPGLTPWGGEPRGRLTVRDEGRGMDAATLQRICEPFFTTRAQTGGTGLGLSVVHGIVAEHRGQLAVSSAPGRGTRFDVLLPLVGVPLALPAAGTEPERAARVRGGGRRVLVVDDDELMRMTLDAMLSRDGYAVRTCPGGQAALSMLSAAPDETDLLVTDFNMPGMTGLALAAEVRRRQAALPVILASGYLSEDLKRGAAAIGGVVLMSKEDCFDRLSALIDETLRAA
jgi:PAS domain S-box-containing protein